jgi:pantoate--beta-alanine ligase
MTTTVVHTVDDLRRALRPECRRAVVMTMGALHDGHAELVREARRSVGPDGTVIVTVFVNPTQFGAGEDFAAYPRTLDDDVMVAQEAGADLVFAPDAVEVYGPAGGFVDESVAVDPGPLGDILEGASRPGHFRGVLTVVAKLMGMTSPDVALFGEKDYQQLTLIRRMVRELSMPIDVLGVPTVREEDGLARSSRNRYLDAEQRAIAALIPRALEAASAETTADAAVAAAMGVLAAEPRIVVDYLVVTDPQLGPAPASGEGRVLVAAKVGMTRLLDNRSVRMGP